MTIVLASQSSNSGNSTTSLSVSKPTSTASGDLLVGIYMYGSAPNGTNMVSPALSGSGWTQLHHISAEGFSNPFNIFVDGVAWYKFAGGSEPTSYTFSDSTTNFTNGMRTCVMMRFTNGLNTNGSIIRATTDPVVAYNPTTNPISGVVGSDYAISYNVTTNFDATTGEPQHNNFSGSGWSSIYSQNQAIGGNYLETKVVGVSGNPSSTVTYDAGINSFSDFSIAITFAIATATVLPNAASISMGAQNAGRAFLVGQKMRASYMASTAGDKLRAVDNPAGPLVPGTNLKASQA